jgi:hypothetical protein
LHHEIAAARTLSISEPPPGIRRTASCEAAELGKLRAAITGIQAIHYSADPRVVVTG